MVTRRPWWASLLLALLAVNSVRAQSAVNLTEAPLLDQCVRNELTLELDGKQTVKQAGKDATFALKVQARHNFVERFLECNGPVADKAARYYTTAERTIRFHNGEESKAALADAHRFLAAYRVKEELVSFSPKDKLTREEVELIDHFDTTVVSGLVPGAAVQVGKSWKVPSHVVQALCGVNGLTRHNVEGKLLSVQGTTAHIQFVGDLEGIDTGAQVAMIINGQCEFDTTSRRIVAVEWKQTDNRQQGPVSPAMTAEVLIKLKRTPIETPPELGNFALVPIQSIKTPPSDLTNIHHKDPTRRFELQHGRDWRVVSPDNNSQLVMRLMERGVFVAQATISPWGAVDPAKVMPLKQFEAEMEKNPGWQLTKLLESKELQTLPKGHLKAYRVEASGQLDGIQTWQYFYLIVSPRGDQYTVTFSMVPQHVQLLGARADELIRELTFPEGAAVLPR